MTTQDQLNQDQANVANAQAQVDTANQNLDAAKTQLNTDTENFKAEHPVLAVLSEIENLVISEAQIIGTDAETTFAGLLAKARSLLN